MYTKVCQFPLYTTFYSIKKKKTKNKTSSIKILLKFMPL